MKSLSNKRSNHSNSFDIVPCIQEAAQDFNAQCAGSRKSYDSNSLPKKSPAIKKLAIVYRMKEVVPFLKLEFLRIFNKR